MIDKLRFFILRTIGCFLVLFSLYFIYQTFGPVLKSEFIYRLNKIKGVHYLVQGDKPSAEKDLPAGRQGKKENVFARILGKQPPVFITPADTEFGLVIPKIDANSKVIANIDAGDYNLYMEALKEGVAHAAGTSLPGKGGNIYLFAHSSNLGWYVGRYNAVFFLLRELEMGDEVDLFFGGRRYIYYVIDKRIVEAGEVHYLTPKSVEEQVTLQTCWPPGTTLRRLLVIATQRKQAN